MNCYNHPSAVAVAQCTDCGKGLCTDCATLYTLPTCNICNRHRIKIEKSRRIKELIFTFGIGIVIAYFFGQLTVYNTDYSFSLKHDIFYYITSTYIFAGIIAGWKTLTSITPRIFLFLPIIGWLIYFAIKLFLSFWVGLVMLPIRTVRNIYRLKQLQKVIT